MVERFASCTYCNRQEPSDPNKLAFFEDKSEGSDLALTTCGHCKYHRQAHEPYVKDHPEVRRPVSSAECPGFKPIGAAEFDRFYCGCRGWD